MQRNAYLDLLSSFGLKLPAFKKVSVYQCAKNNSSRLLFSTKYFSLKLKTAKSFAFESMSLFEINFIIEMLGKLDKLGLGVFKKNYAIKL